MDSESFTGEPLGPSGGFNWVFLVELVVCAILAVFFLFYFNRLFATLVSYGVRAFTWHKYRAYIDITALQISLLGGRLFFKSLSYQAHNETVLVHDGHITWRYWLPVVKEAEIFKEQDGKQAKRGRKQEASGSDRSDKNVDEKAGSEDGSRSESPGRAENAGQKPKKELPCRISIKVSGVEAFIYNNSLSYDAVANATKAHAQRQNSGSSDDQASSEDQDSSSASEKEKIFPKVSKTATQHTEGTEKSDNLNTTPSPSQEPSKKANIPAWLRMLPIKIECKKAAAAVGNEHTTSVITAKLEHAVGTVDASSSNPLDLYKLLLAFDFEKINVQMRPNRDFKQKQLDSAQRVLQERETQEPPNDGFNVRPIQRARSIWLALTKSFSFRKKSSGSVRTASYTSSGPKGDKDLKHRVEDQQPGNAPWHGLTRYLDDNDVNEHEEWDPVEYARCSTIVDCERVGMCFHFDMPGTVPPVIEDPEMLADGIYEDDMNGAKPPDYGLDLYVHGGTVTYGPWADRQRLVLQSVFFPQTFVDAKRPERLKVGDTRVATVMKIFVSVEEDVVLRIPTREPSKDFKWKGRSKMGMTDEDEHGNQGKGRSKHGRKFNKRLRKGKTGPSGADIRPYAWLDIKVEKDTVVNYTMDYFIRKDSYVNKLDIDCKGLEMNSSVNHGLLWRSGPLSLEADLSMAETWNTLRRWPFKIVVDDMRLFILRDHFFLIIDIVNDWSSGPMPDFFTFVPYLYKMDLTLNNWIMYLNTNDANIINDPADFDGNDYLTLEGKILAAVLDIPQQTYRPLRNQIGFDCLCTDMSMRMLNSSRNTLRTLLHDKLVATLPRLTLKGSFNSNMEVGEGLVDCLRMDLVGTGLDLKAYGYLVGKHFINVKENYFGDYIHFKTLEEFQNAADDFQTANEKTAFANEPKAKDGNELDVILCIVAEDASVLAPTNLYSMREHVRAELPYGAIDIRINSYYFDMAINMSPISILSGSSLDPDSEPGETASSTQLYISKLDLYGHRLFGLGPEETQYYTHWDVDVGSITGECSNTFIKELAKAGKAFAFTFEDGENALPITMPYELHDTVFVQVRTEILRIWLHVGNDALLVSANPVSVDVNDWSRGNFTERVCVLVPDLTFACVDAKSASRKRAKEFRKRPVKTYAFLQTSVALNVAGRQKDFDGRVRKQQAHFRKNDQRTSRIPFLKTNRVVKEDDPEYSPDVQAPAQQYPGLPSPLDRQGQQLRRPASVKSTSTFFSHKSVGSKKSNSSLAASIRGQTLAVPGTGKEGSSRASSRSGRSGRSSLNSSAPSSHPALPGDEERARFGLAPSTMAFSSSFAEPYFPLDLVEPDQTNVPRIPEPDDADDSTLDASSPSEEIHEPELDRDFTHTNVFVKLTTGLRVYAEPQLAIAAAEIVSMLQPSDPEDALDNFQMDVLGAIVGQQQERHGSSQVIDVNVELPRAALRISNPGENGGESDQVDLDLTDLDLKLRIKQQPSSAGAVKSFAVHNTLDSVKLALRQNKEGTLSDPALEMTVRDLLIWLAFADNKSLHVQVRDTLFGASSSQAGYAVDLILRLLPQVEDIVQRFATPLQRVEQRLHCLVLTLTEHGEDVPDPPFLTRMTYVLRAFPDHYRNQASWKVISRFRHILQSLEQHQFESLKRRLQSDKPDCGENTAANVLQTWAQWRNWDVPNVGQTLAFRRLFNEEDAKTVRPPQTKPTALTVRAETFRIAVDKGPKGSEILIEETSLGVDITPPTTPTGLMLVEENTRTKTVMQLHSNAISFLFDWELCRIPELVLPYTSRIAGLSSQSPYKERRTAGRALEDNLDRHDFHIAISTSESSLTFKTINLRLRSQAETLKMSLIGTTQANEEYGQAISALIHSDAAMTECFGQERCIWQTLLTGPSLYIDHLEPSEGKDFPPTVTLAAAYRELQVLIKEPLPGILHVADDIVLNEVAKIKELVEGFTANSQNLPDQALVGPTKSVGPPKIHVALLAGNLHLEMSLLQSLSYQLLGTAARVRIAPSLSEHRLLGIDFDIGKQNHSFINRTSGELDQQEIVTVPPINGHVGLQLKENETSVSVVATIERIEVDAGAVQGLLTVVSQSEVQHILSSVQNGVTEIKEHVQEVFPPREKPGTTAQSAGKEIFYDARLALAGVRVSAVTPHAKDDWTSELEFGIGPLHASVSNRQSLPTSGGIRLPEVRVQIRGIGATLATRDKGHRHQCGHVGLGANVHFTSRTDDDGKLLRELKIHSHGIGIDFYPDTASTIVDIVNHLQNRIKELDLSKERDYIRRLRDSRREKVVEKIKSRREDAGGDQQSTFSTDDLLSTTVTFELTAIKAVWHVSTVFAAQGNGRVENPVLSLARICFTTHGGNEARLTIDDLQLQLTPKTQSDTKRTLNSALLPEIGFSVAYWRGDRGRRLAFKATGKPLDLRLESKFLIPVSAVQRSMEYAKSKFQKGTATWKSTQTSGGAPRANLLGNKGIASILVEAEFAGANVYLQGAGAGNSSISAIAASAQEHGAQHGRYGQFAAEGKLMHTSLSAPGIALKLQYNDGSREGRESIINTELRVDASSNSLLPNVVPLVLEISNSVKDAFGSRESEAKKPPEPSQEHRDSSATQETFINADPSQIFGKTKVNIGIRVKKQEFSLTCQPIARIDAAARLDDFYLTMNTIDSDEHGHFFAVSAVLTKVDAHVKHMYSREPTFSFDMDSIVLSLMNSKHLSGVNGVSAILKINPTRTTINAKQLQDLLLFREIWLPPEIRNPQQPNSQPQQDQQQQRADDYLVNRYQTVAAAAAFPWNATITIAELGADLDLGQSVGKSSFTIRNLWASSQKSSDWEQNMCIGMDHMGMESSGRMSGFIELGKLGVRTSIKWPEGDELKRKTPLVQASVGFQRLRAKASFDYQPFAFGDIGGFDFLMYNVREASQGTRDRLVAVLDCAKAYVFCTSTSPAQALALYQAFDRLIQEKQTAYVQSLRDIEKHLRRQSTVVPTRFGPQVDNSPAVASQKKSIISLNTDVVLTLGSISVGAFPSTFFDRQILKLEANNIQARFAVGLEKGRIHSGLGMTLGQLQVALAAVKRRAVPKSLGDISVDEVIDSAVTSSGGTILRVPKVVASMQTWQTPDTNAVDYIFKSLFEGKIDVGWNLSRINFIKGMYTTHSRSLASRLGKPLPQSAVKITAGPQAGSNTPQANKESTPSTLQNTLDSARSSAESAAQRNSPDDSEQAKITAEVNLPQSKYTYTPLEEPVIETPQLRDMGEATPPLEWIGLHRERLPNVTHQIVIVSLLEIAREVGEGYERILGSSREVGGMGERELEERREQEGDGLGEVEDGAGEKNGGEDWERSKGKGRGKANGKGREEGKDKA
ncbi:hypothetical protein MBLNU230_g5023t1 [Neophaeotheca triangularis]